MSSPMDIIERIRAWQPLAYLIARAVVYAVTFVLSAIAIWYGEDPQPDWLPRATAVGGFVSGSLALVNLSRPNDDGDQ